MGWHVGRHWWVGACGLGSWKGCGQASCVQPSGFPRPTWPPGLLPVVTLGAAWGHLPFIQRPPCGQRCPGVPRHKWPLPVCPEVPCHSAGVWGWPDSGGCLLGRGFGSSAGEAASLLLSGSSLLWTQALHAAGGQASAMGGSFPELECCGEQGRWPLLANLPCARLCAGGCTDVCSFILLSAPAREVASTSRYR